MTIQGETELVAAFRGVLERIADALERLSPPKVAHERKPAVLGTATYNPEEREKRELREKLRGKKNGIPDSHQAG
jgi:hypothetical protein